MCANQATSSHITKSCVWTELIGKALAATSNKFILKNQFSQSSKSKCFVKNTSIQFG